MEYKFLIAFALLSVLFLSGCESTQEEMDFIIRDKEGVSHACSMDENGCIRCQDLVIDPQQFCDEDFKK